MRLQLCRRIAAPNRIFSASGWPLIHGFPNLQVSRAGQFLLRCGLKLLMLQDRSGQNPRRFWSPEGWGFFYCVLLKSGGSQGCSVAGWRLQGCAARGSLCPSHCVVGTASPLPVCSLIFGIKCGFRKQKKRQEESWGLVFERSFILGCMLLTLLSALSLPS